MLVIKLALFSNSCQECWQRLSGQTRQSFVHHQLPGGICHISFRIWCVYRYPHKVCDIGKCRNQSGSHGEPSIFSKRKGEISGNPLYSLCYITSV